jgi:hypothetical protein
VTAGARIHIYSYLNRLQNKAIYCDTDSCIYVQPNESPPLVETRDKFGEITSDLKPDEFISQVVCAGPKTYGYKTVNTKTPGYKMVCNVRGITLNYHAFKLVNFAKMKEKILSTDADENVIVRSQD